jgi:mono/diheme cytochrome c family protein
MGSSTGRAVVTGGDAVLSQRAMWRRVLATAVAFAALTAATGCESATGPRKEISGEVLYNQYCARCHGPGGEPVVPGAPNFADPNVMAGLSDMGMKGIIRKGVEARRNPATGDVIGEGMPGFDEQFTDATLMVLVAYVRGFTGATPGRPAADG